MPLEFWKVYRVMGPGSPGSDLFAMGVIETELDDGRPGFAFLVPGWGFDPVAIAGRIVRDLGDEIHVVDDLELDDEGRPIRHVLRVLGHQDIVELKDDIGGAAGLLRKVHSDAGVQRWYVTKFFVPVLSGWLERQGRLATRDAGLSMGPIH